jgi:hypothetical protein
MWSEETRDITSYIICGRGKSSYNCEGNKVFRQSVGKHMKSYMTFQTRAKKSHLILRVAEELRNLGMIFMAISDDGITLKELSPAEARKKVAHRFRDAARATKRLEAISEGRRCLRTDQITYKHQGKQNNAYFTVGSPCLQDQESTNLMKSFLLSDSLKREEGQHSTQSDLTRTLRFLTELESEDHSQKVLAMSAQRVHDPITFFPLSHECRENMPLQYDKIRKREAIFSDLIALIDTSPNTDYGEDFDDLSMLLTDCDETFLMEY